MDDPEESPLLEIMPRHRVTIRVRARRVRPGPRTVPVDDSDHDAVGGVIRVVVPEDFWFLDVRVPRRLEPAVVSRSFWTTQGERPAPRARRALLYACMGHRADTAIRRGLDPLTAYFNTSTYREDWEAFVNPDSYRRSGPATPFHRYLGVDDRVAMLMDRGRHVKCKIDLEFTYDEG
jgi:hypothetical protein